MEQRCGEGRAGQDGTGAGGQGKMEQGQEGGAMVRAGKSRWSRGMARAG